MTKTNNLLNNAIMSEKSKLNRVKREAKQEQHAKNVMKWLSIALLTLAIILIVIALNT